MNFLILHYLMNIYILTKMRNNSFRYHFLALITVIIWGLTFVSTKVLIAGGLGPAEIFLMRFSIAYLCALALSHNRLWADNIRDEVMMALAGITGGSLYFISENTALSYTFASNVALIICCAPIFTAFLGRQIYGEKTQARLWIGSAIAFTGVIMVVFNGMGNYGISPLGDLLTGMAALSWAVYCLILKGINTRYDNPFITRKVFAYGVLTAGIYYLFIAHTRQIIITDIWPIVWNLVFLSLGASFLCYLMWNVAVKYLGPEITTNYIYLTPIVTILTSTIVLDEPFTVILALGTIMTIAGVFISTRTHT